MGDANLGTSGVCCHAGQNYCTCAGCVIPDTSTVVWGGDCACSCVPPGQEPVPALLDGGVRCCGLCDPPGVIPAEDDPWCSRPGGCECQCNGQGADGTKDPDVIVRFAITGSSPGPGGAGGGCGCRSGASNGGGSCQGGTECETHALAQAGSWVDVVRRLPEPPGRVQGGSAGSADHAQIDPSVGKLVLTLAPPPTGGFTIPPALTYNSNLSSTTSEFGHGWTSTFRRSVATSGFGSQILITVTTGDGSRYEYLIPGAGGGVGYATPRDGAVNSMLLTAAPQTFTETQPDGLQFRYGSNGALQSIRNPAGSRWTLSHDTGGRIRRVTDPFGCATSYAYDGSSKLRRIQDVGGRISSVTIDAGGNLVRFVGPSSEHTTITYDGAHRPQTWIDPRGQRTSYAFDGSGQIAAVTLPQGQRTTLAYPAFGTTVLTNPLSRRLTLTFNGDGTIHSLRNPAGVATTYAWDVHGRLSGYGDGRGYRTSFTYTTLAKGFERS